MFRAFNLSSKNRLSKAEKILLTYQTFAISVKVPTPYTTQPPCHNCVAILGGQVVSWNCKWAFSCLFFLVLVPFSFFPNFSSKISPQPLKIETLYLVYRSTTTSCIVELQMGILLFVLPCVCPFFFLSKFFVKDISITVKDRNFIFGIQVHNDKLYRGIANGHSPICSTMCLSLFLSFQIFRQIYLHNC